VEEVVVVVPGEALAGSQDYSSESFRDIARR
jgi:hypothetical protein